MKNKILSWIAGAGLMCATVVASLSVASVCLIYYYQPKAPQNISARFIVSQIVKTRLSSVSALPQNLFFSLYLDFSYNNASYIR